MRASYPFVSPDGKQVTYTDTAGAIYLTSMDGGAQQTVAEKGSSAAASWSPEGNLLVYADYGESQRTKFWLYDLRTGSHTLVPESQDLVGVQWVGENLLVAASRDHTKLVLFDVKTQKWSDLVSLTEPGIVINWAHALDYKYVYYTIGGPEPQALRVRLADRKVEIITSLKDLPRAAGTGGQTQISVAPDGSAVFTRDIGSQEVYALTVKWP